VEAIFELEHPERAAQPGDALLLLAVALTGTYALSGAGVITRAPGLGATLLVLAAIQSSWLLGAGSLRTRALMVGAALNLGLIGVWLLSRTAGLPLGAPGVQPVGLLDLLCTIDSAAIVVLALSLAQARGGVIQLPAAVLQGVAAALAVASLSALMVSHHSGSAPARAGAAGTPYHFFCPLL
jgi:hypothetical protein